VRRSGSHGRRSGTGRTGTHPHNQPISIDHLKVGKTSNALVRSASNGQPANRSSPALPFHAGCTTGRRLLYLTTATT
jgi:hypothetical protein